MSFSFTFNDTAYLIKEYEESDKSKMLEYFHTCKVENITNNTSFKTIKMSTFPFEKWWIVYDVTKNIIISISGAYKFTEYNDDSWRIMFRTATLKNYRGKAGPISKFQKSCFAWGRLLPFQVDYCRSHGAKDIIFTTNSSGKYQGSIKQDKICKEVFVKYNLIEHIDQIELYHVKQNLWRVLIRDVYNIKK